MSRKLTYRCVVNVVHKCRFYFLREFTRRGDSGPQGLLFERINLLGNSSSLLAPPPVPNKLTPPANLFFYRIPCHIHKVRHMGWTAGIVPPIRADAHMLHDLPLFTHLLRLVVKLLAALLFGYTQVTLISIKKLLFKSGSGIDGTDVENMQSYGHKSSFCHLPFQMSFGLDQ